jgi:hypothetical protein
MQHKGTQYSVDQAIPSKLGHTEARQGQKLRWTSSEANPSRQMHCLLSVMTFIDEWRKFSPFAKRSHP